MRKRITLLSLEDRPLQNSQSVSSPFSLMPQEQWLYERLCEGQLADLNDDGLNNFLSHTDSSHWPQSRILRPSFLRRMLLEKLYRQAIPVQGVRVCGARFDEALDLSHAT